MKTTDELLTVREAAALLAVDISTLRKWIAARRIDTVKLFSKSVRIPRAQVEALIANGYRRRVESPEAVSTG